MTAYDMYVSEKLGDDAWNLLIESVNRGQITRQHSDDIARLLADKIKGSKIFGAHKNRMEDRGWGWGNQELGHILANWYS